MAKALGQRRHEGDRWHFSAAAVVAAVAARLPAAAVATTAAAATVTSSWSRQGVAVVTVATAVAAATAVGLLPRLSVSSHSRGRKLISFL